MLKKSANLSKFAGAALVGLALSPLAQATTQMATLMTIDPVAYPSAKCNDGTQPKYWFIPATGANLTATEKKSYFIQFHGGGSCTSDAECVARWDDYGTTRGLPFGNPDGQIGDRSEMTTVPAGATLNFSGKGPLDADGANGKSNVFARYNRILVPYCSSDLWVGNGGSAPIIAANPHPNNNPFPAGNVFIFAGAKIQDAVIDIVKNGKLANGGSAAGDPVIKPDTTSAEVVLSGSSAGAFGIFFGIDRMKTNLGTTPKVYGIADSGDDIGLSWNWTESSMPAKVDYLDGSTNVEPAYDASCKLVYSTAPWKCLINAYNFGGGKVVTPLFVSQNAYDNAVHIGYLTAPAPYTQTEATIRQAITKAWVNDLSYAKGVYIPDYAGGYHHQEATTNEYYYADEVAPPSSGSPQLTGANGTTGTRSFSTAVAAFRTCVLDSTTCAGNYLDRIVINAMSSNGVITGANGW